MLRALHQPNIVTFDTVTVVCKSLRERQLRSVRPSSKSAGAHAYAALQDALGEGEDTHSRSSRHGRLTQVLAAASVVPALLLAVQPLVSGSCAAAPPAAVVDWQGPLRDMFSFTVLLSVFIGCEPGAAAASAVSATGAALTLFAGPTLPPWLACCTAAALVASATVVLATACLASSNSRGGCSSSISMRWGFQWHPKRVLSRVQPALGVLGGGLLTQYFSGVGDSTIAAAGMQWLAPMAVGAAAVLVAGRLVAGSGDKQLRLLWADWPAWSATLLLVLQPLQLLVESSFQPLQVLPGVSASQQLLLLLASGLMVPRALLQAELMWFTGTASAACLAAGQLAVLGVHNCLAGQLQHGLGSSTAAAAAGATGSRAGQLQQWVLDAAPADPSSRTAATITAMCLALLASCILLQCGWLHIEGAAAAAGGE